jgi:hypothetical protein
MDKVVRNGLVAVLYSPGYGSGWYTWNTEYLQILYDPKIVEWVEAGKPEDQLDSIETYMESTYPDTYIGSNLTQLEIIWMPVGTQFQVHEYDGYESIKYASEQKWQTA